MPAAVAEAPPQPLAFDPRCVFDLEEVREAVAVIKRYGAFVVDLETDGLHHKTNEVLWIGIGTWGRNWIIPIGHPNGKLIEPEHSVKVPIPGTSRPYANNPNKFTKPKTRTERVPATFGPPPRQLRPDQVFGVLEELFFDPEIVCVGHNVQFDLLSMTKYFGGRVPTCLVEDTIILQHILDESLPDYKLKSLIPKHFLGKQLASDRKVREEYYPDLGKKIMTSSFQDVARYLTQDVTFTWLFWKHLRSRLDERLARVFEIDMQLYPVLMRMKDWGIYINIELLQQRKEEIEREIRDLEVEAWRIAGAKFDLTNVGDKIHYLFGKKSEGGQGLKPVSFTAKTAKPQVTKEVLAKLADQVDEETGTVIRQGNRLATILQRWAELHKVISTYMTPYLEEGALYRGRIHGTFNQHRVETGRLSSSEPNLQNIPRGGVIRETFCAPPGRKLIVADYDQIELRVQAHLANDPEMISIFVKGEVDIHTETAAAMFNKPPDKITSEERSAGKVFNFLVNYGGSAWLLAQNTGHTEEEAQQFIDNYYRRFRRINPWKATVLEKALRRGNPANPYRNPPTVLIPPFGRRRRIPELYTKPYDRESRRVLRHAQRQAVNCMVQGMASYIMKLALIALDPALEPYDAHLVLTVHDEVVVECPAELAEQVRAVVQSTMEGVTYRGQPIIGKVPLTAEANIGDNWYEAKG